MEADSNRARLQDQESLRWHQDLWFHLRRCVKHCPSVILSSRPLWGKIDKDCNVLVTRPLSNRHSSQTACCIFLGRVPVRLSIVLTITSNPCTKPLVPLDRIMKWNSSAIITIFTTIKIMMCGELVGCVESHGGAGCLPRVNSNAHGAQCAQHILADQVRFNEIFQHISFLHPVYSSLYCCHFHQHCDPHDNGSVTHGGILIISSQRRHFQATGVWLKTLSSCSSPPSS